MLFLRQTDIRANENTVMKHWHVHIHEILLTLHLVHMLAPNLCCRGGRWEGRRRMTNVSVYRDK